LAVLKLAILVSGVLALAKLGFLDFVTGGFDTGRFGGFPDKIFIFTLNSISSYRRSSTMGFTSFYDTRRNNPAIE
jgi:hypothetical protein